MNLVAPIGQNWNNLPLLETFRQYLNVNHTWAIVSNMSTEKHIRHSLWPPVPAWQTQTCPSLEWVSHPSNSFRIYWKETVEQCNSWKHCIWVSPMPRSCGLSSFPTTGACLEGRQEEKVTMIGATRAAIFLLTGDDFTPHLRGTFGNVWRRFLMVSAVGRGVRGGGAVST